MGREVRRVPPNWDHPMYDNKYRGREPQPMFNERHDDAMAEWQADFARAQAGDEEVLKYYADDPDPLAAWLDDNPSPDPAYYRPWHDDDATWFQVWETVSEGTPVTPPFATREELVDHLVKHGDEWDQYRGNGGWSRAHAESFVNAGWAPSMIVETQASGPAKIFEPRDGYPSATE